MTTKFLKIKYVTIFAMAIAANALLSAYNFPWTTSSISLPDAKSNIQISVRRAHPMTAEYDYRITGKLTDGKDFSVDLIPQSGGQALMSIDYLPKVNSAGYLRFELKDTPHKSIKLQYLNLQSGVLEEPKDIDWSYIKELGFIDLSMRFRKPFFWLKANELAELAYINHDFEEAYKYAFSMKQEAGISKDKGLLVTSCYLMARIARNSKPIRRDDIIQCYTEAIENSENYGEKRADGLEVVPKFRLQLSLASFYSQQKMYPQAKENVWAVIESLKGSDGGKWKLSDTDRALITVEADIEAARLELKQGFKLKATQMISALSPNKLKNDDEMRKSWGELYPNIVVLEYDIWNQLYLNPNGDPLVVSATFEITPKGDIENLKIFPSTGDKNECDALVANGIYAVEASGKTKLPIIDKLRCKLTLDCKPNDFKVAIVPMKN